MAEFFEAKEAARMLRVHRETIYRAIQRGDLRASRTSPRGRFRIPLEEMDRYLKENQIMPAKSEKQRKFMGAELARKRRGQKTKTGMSTKQLKDFAKRPKKKRKKK